MPQVHTISDVHATSSREQPSGALPECAAPEVELMLAEPEEGGLVNA